MNTKLIAILAIVFAAVVFTTVESSHLRVPQNKVKKELNTLENVRNKSSTASKKTKSVIEAALLCCHRVSTRSKLIGFHDLKRG